MASPNGSREVVFPSDNLLYILDAVAFVNIPLCSPAHPF